MTKGNYLTVKQEVSKGDIEFVRMLADGMTVKEISEKKDKSVRTLEAVVDRMRGEYGCRNIAELVATFFRNKLIN